MKYSLSQFVSTDSLEVCLQLKLLLKEISLQQLDQSFYNCTVKKKDMVVIMVKYFYNNDVWPLMSSAFRFCCRLLSRIEVHGLCGIIDARMKIWRFKRAKQNQSLMINWFNLLNLRNINLL